MFCCMLTGLVVTYATALFYVRELRDVSEHSSEGAMSKCRVLFCIACKKLSTGKTRKCLRLSNGNGENRFRL